MQKFDYQTTPIKDLIVVKARRFEDNRGYFLKSFEQESMNAIGISMNVTEVNESKSLKGVVRGLHFQKQAPQAKLVRAAYGCAYDVAVDLRKGSETFGQWYGVTLSDENRTMFYIPKGFAHGYLTLSDVALFQYVCDGKYVPGDEGGILWNDEKLAIDWPLEGISELILSEKDKIHPTLREFMEQYQGYKKYSI